MDEEYYSEYFKTIKLGISSIDDSLVGDLLIAFRNRFRTFTLLALYDACSKNAPFHHVEFWLVLNDFAYGKDKISPQNSDYWNMFNFVKGFIDGFNSQFRKNK